jgi:hypothetical protein
MGVCTSPLPQQYNLSLPEATCMHGWMHHGFTKLAVVLAPKDLTQQSAQFLLLYHTVGLHVKSRGCTTDLPSSSTKHYHTAISTVLVVVLYCWVGRSRINLMHVM